MEKRAYGTATVKFKKRILGNDLIFEKWGIGTREVTLFETWLQIKRVCYGYVIFLSFLAIFEHDGSFDLIFSLICSYVIKLVCSYVVKSIRVKLKTLCNTKKTHVWPHF